jgi:hypothetical protein
MIFKKKLPKWNIYKHNFMENTYLVKLDSAIQREESIINRLIQIRWYLNEATNELKLIDELIAELEEQ